MKPITHSNTFTSPWQCSARTDPLTMTGKPPSIGLPAGVSTPVTSGAAYASVTTLDACNGVAICRCDDAP